MLHIYIRRWLYLGVILELVFVFGVGSVCLCSFSIASLLQGLAPSSFPQPVYGSSSSCLSFCDSLTDLLLLFQNILLLNNFQSPLLFRRRILLVESSHLKGQYWYVSCSWAGCLFSLICKPWEVLRVCLPGTDPFK